MSATILTHLNSTLEEEKREGLTHYLKASDLHTSDYYGWQTAISDDGNTLAVLAYRAPAVTTNATDDAGAIYVYRRSGQVGKSEDFAFEQYQLPRLRHGDECRWQTTGCDWRILYVFLRCATLIDSTPDWDGTWSVSVTVTAIQILEILLH